MKHRRSFGGGLALALAGSILTLIGSAAPLPNAWQITDHSGVGGSTLIYTNQLSASHRVAATNAGFRYTVNARFVTDFGDSASLHMAYGLGSRRFLIWWDLDDNGDLTAELDNGPIAVLTTNGSGSDLYYTHEIIYDPSTQSASYLFDGQVIATNWQSSANAAAAGRISWGAGSSAGQGQINFNRVTFEITNTVVASYDAGTAGNPATATNPAPAWTLAPSSPPLNTSVTNISPDNALLLPVAKTQAADLFTASTARLNGLANARGSTTTAWFEWGTDTNYSNATILQAAGSANTNKPVSDGIGGLAIETNYFFRLVTSNAFGIAAGTNRTFNLSWFLPLVATSVADQLTNTSARLTGQVNPNGSLTLAWFEWGTDTNYGNTTGAQNVGAGIFPTDNTAVIGGLVGGPNYHYRHVASNAVGMVLGEDKSFTLAFLLTSIPGLPGMDFGSAVWGDYDNDGRLDFLITGTQTGDGNGGVSQLWRNTGSGFSNVTASAAPGLPGGYEASVAWGDFDYDGRLDFLLSGYSTNVIVTQVWRNTGSGFTNVPIPSLRPAYLGCVAWGDYNNDGRLDFLRTGSTNSSSLGIVSELWRNTGAGFTYEPIPGLPGVWKGSVAWGDYDNDGWLDFLLTGDASPEVSQLWRNTLGVFSNVTASVAPGLPGVFDGSVAWGDYDNDGHLDFLIMGNSSTGRVSQLWRNLGSEFTNVTASVAPGLPEVSNSSVAWGDYDNDGRPDFLFTGEPASGTTISQLWRNTGGGFTNVTISGLPGVNVGSVAWGDYDNDGRLDFLITGLDDPINVSQLWRNNLSIPNPPTAIMSLSVTNNAGGGTNYQTLIRNDGSLLAAVNLGHTGPNLTRNGVTFVSTPGGNPSGLNWSAAGPAADDGLGNVGIDDLFFSEIFAGSPCTLTYSNLNAGQRYVVQILHGEPRQFFATTFRSNTLATSRNAAAPIPAFALGNNVAGENPPASNDVAIITAELQGTTFFKYTCRNTPTRGGSIAGFQVRDITALIARPRIFQPVLQGNGQFRFSFSNQTVVTYQVLGTTNVALPVNQWQVLGLPVSLGGGLYQFADAPATNQQRRFYQLRAL